MFDNPPLQSKLQDGLNLLHHELPDDEDQDDAIKRMMEDDGVGETDIFYKTESNRKKK